VGVFADNDVDMINEVARAAPLDLIQLSGKESPDMAQQLVKPCLKVHTAASPI
jgi:phosphoribosylanthranilate isomerase